MVNPTQLLLAICLLLPTVFGCSCVYPPEYSTSLESLCRDFQWSDDVFAGRVISASCNCIPSLNDSSYGQANISCLWSTIAEYFTSEIVAGATCDAGFREYGILSCDRLLNSFKPTECPHEGQVYMDCAPYCPETCSSEGVASSCQQSPPTCVGGCVCPEGMVINKELGRCAMPSQCPHKNCPIEGQVYTDCGSSCPGTCDNVNDTIICDTACRQGCECPSGMVIDTEQRRCVEPSQCRREPPTIIARTSENGSCAEEYVCPFNTPNDYSPCQYTVEVIEVFKGDNEVGQMITTDGPDLLTTCGNPNNILSVGTTYVVGIGGACSAHSEWTPYSQYPAEERQALFDGCNPVDGNGSESIYPFGQLTLIATILAKYFVFYI